MDALGLEKNYSKNPVGFVCPTTFYDVTLPLPGGIFTTSVTPACQSLISDCLATLVQEESMENILQKAPCHCSQDLPQ